MSSIYRTAICINRKQPYVEWANSFEDDGPELTLEEELAGWMEYEADWPATRAREMFNAWFDAEMADTVIDLAPDEPLTDVDGIVAGIIIGGIIRK